MTYRWPWTALMALALSISHVQAQDSSASTAAADTGRMMPGRFDFSRYTTPGDCDAATWGVIRSARVHRTPDPLDPQDHDTLQGALDVDTLPAAAVEIARRCGSHFAVATTAPRDLDDLAQLALLMRNDAEATEVITRRLALTSTVRERADALRSFVDMYRAARPAQLQTAQSLLAKLDAMGTPALRDRIDEHMILAKDFEQRFDRAGMRHEINAVLAAYDQLSPVDRDELMVQAQRAYLMLLDLQMFENPKAVDSVLDRATADLRSVKGSGVAHGIFSHAWWASMPGWQQPALPPVTYWYNTDTTNKPPVPGRLTLFVDQSGDPSTIRRVYERYHTKGLDLVMLVRTVGYADIKGEKQVTSPPEEAEAYRHQFLEQEGLPIMLGVVVPSFTRDSVTGERIDPNSVGMPSALLDRRGHLVTDWNCAPEELPRLEAYLDRELARR